MPQEVSYEIREFSVQLKAYFKVCFGELALLILVQESFFATFKAEFFPPAI